MDMYILAIHCGTRNRDIRAAAIRRPRGSEKSSVKRKIQSVTSIPLPSCFTTDHKLPLLAFGVWVGLFSFSTFSIWEVSTVGTFPPSTYFVSSVDRQALSFRPHFSAICSKVPSANMTSSVSCTWSLSLLFPFLKPIPYSSEDNRSSNIRNESPFADNW